MSQVAATMGISSDAVRRNEGDFKLLSDAAKEAGSSTQFSATQSAEALNYLALAGNDAQTSVSLLPTVLNAAAAGGLDLGYASDLITDSMGALGLETKDTTTFVDRLTKTPQKSKTSMGQLAEAILTVGGTAKKLKGGTVELTTALGILADEGTKGSEAGTALRNIILSLAAPTDTAAKELKKLGVSAYDTNGNFRSLDDIFIDLHKSTNNLSESAKNQAFTKIFNKTDLKAVETMIANCGVSKSIDVTQSAGVKTNITSSTKVLFLYDGASDYVEAINNSVYINNARDNNGNHNGAVKYNIRFKVIITESYKWNNVGNVISSESYGSIDRHKDISFNTSTLLHKDTDNSYYGSFSIISKANADEEEYSAEYITNNNIIITLYVRRPRLYWQIWCNAILEQKDQPFIVNVNNVTRTKLYNNNTITEGCAGSGEQYLYLFSTSNMMTSRSITVKLIRNNNPNDACKLTGFTNINTHTKTSVGLEEDKTVIRTFVTSYIQTLPINLCEVTFKYAKLDFRVLIAKGTGN